MILALIALGGAAGSVLRYLLASAFNPVARGELPIGTLGVNIIGCFLIGVFARAFMNTGIHDQLRVTLMVGFCGGFTTFSAFSLETLALIQGGRLGYAALYIAASVGLCLVATLAGSVAARGITL